MNPSYLANYSSSKCFQPLKDISEKTLTMVWVADHPPSLSEVTAVGMCAKSIVEPVPWLLTNCHILKWGPPNYSPQARSGDWGKPSPSWAVRIVQCLWISVFSGIPGTESPEITRANYIIDFLSGPENLRATCHRLQVIKFHFMQKHGQICTVSRRQIILTWHWSQSQTDHTGLTLEHLLMVEHLFAILQPLLPWNRWCCNGEH